MNELATTPHIDVPAMRVSLDQMHELLDGVIATVEAAEKPLEQLRAMCGDAIDPQSEAGYFWFRMQTATASFREVRDSMRAKWRAMNSAKKSL